MNRQQSSLNTVFASGLDGYHFKAMLREFTDEQIILGIASDIRTQHPQQPGVEALREACAVFEYLTAQTAGEGCCRRVRQELQRGTRPTGTASSIVAAA